jgi:nucleoside-diphosphate-sugar epimerase
MKVFVTGANGWIGSAVVSELIEVGHDVVGLVRSDEAAAAVAAAGAEPRLGSIEDLDGLRSAAAAADGVIHTAYHHDFSEMEKAAQMDRQAIEALASALEGSDRPLIITTGVALAAPGEVATENDASSLETHPRVATERMALDLASQGLRLSVVRPAPTVHGPGDHGFLAMLVAIAREEGVSGYIEDGSNHWPAVHRLDAAHLYVLALEKASAGTVLHAVAEEGVPTREIAEAIGRSLGLPVASIPREDVADHFGFLGGFFGLDIRASSALTREWMGWEPVQPGLIADLEAHSYYREAAGA